MKKIAVVLFNIGGPTKLSEVKPYLMNFFSDKHIIRLPFLFRKLLAFIISRTRYKKTSDIYSKIGGASPLLKNTKQQADSLELALNKDANKKFNYEVLISMRYWHPFSTEAIEKITKNSEQYEQIILLPLYPQCSSTTTVSSYNDWVQNFKNKELLKRTKLICNHYSNEKFLQAYCNLILPEIEKAIEISKNEGIKYKLFFSAHSIPEYLVTKLGDPYQMQIESTVEKIISKLEKIKGEKIDYLITYQSKVGRMKWLEPKTEDELIICAKSNTIPIIIPIAFVSENSETLFELDMDYKELVAQNGMKHFFRVSTVSCEPLYIESLCDLIEDAINSSSQFPTKRRKECGKTFCPCVQYENIS